MISFLHQDRQSISLSRAGYPVQLVNIAVQRSKLEFKGQEKAKMEKLLAAENRICSIKECSSVTYYTVRGSNSAHSFHDQISNALNGNHDSFLYQRLVDVATDVKMIN